MPFLRTRLRSWLTLGAILSALAVSCMGFGMGVDSMVQAQVFNGPGLEGGVNTAATIDGPSKRSLRLLILLTLRYVMDFLALAAVIMIVVAGIFLLFSNGEDGAKDKAKMIIKFVIIGLIIILFARAIVGFFTRELPAAL